MIIEQATVSVAPERMDEFAEVFEGAAEVLLGAEGCRSAVLLRNVEDAGVCQIVVTWETLEDHTVGFRQSPAYAEWRAMVGGFFISSPSVLHYVAI